MATSGKTDGAVFTGVEWSGSPVTFHENKGKNVRLTEGNKVATRVNACTDLGFGIVFTGEPLSVGQLLNVTVAKTANIKWMGGLDIGFTGEDPTNSRLTECDYLTWQRHHKQVLRTESSALHYNDKELCVLGFNSDNFRPGQSLGLLLTRDRECHWFRDNMWRGAVCVRDFPLDQPMWGVVDVYAECEQVKADIWTVCKYPPDSERRLMEMGLITEPRPSMDDLQQQIIQTFARVQILFGMPSNSTLERQLTQAQSDNQQLQQELTQERKRAAAEIQQLTRSNEQLQRTNAENQQLVATLRAEVDMLQRRVGSVPSNAKEAEFWQVSPDEVSVREDQILGRGAWGYVAKGTFRGTTVAVKRIYTEILQQTTVDRIRREIRTMAQIRHPNLVLFVAAVLSEGTGPMIVTELLDTSLREAYQTNRAWGPTNEGSLEMSPPLYCTSIDRGSPSSTEM